MITLEELLESRDARVRRQQSLQAAYPLCTLVCFTVQLPGEVKRSPDSLIIGGAGLAALLGRFGSVLEHVQVQDLPTGYEAYLLVKLPAATVKKICCEIEQTHPLGRLMDIDVPGVSRESLGLGPRRCLLCGREVRVCMRLGTHSREALLARIHEMVEDFVQKN